MFLLVSFIIVDEMMVLKIIAEISKKKKTKFLNYFFYCWERIKMNIKNNIE